MVRKLVLMFVLVVCAAALTACNGSQSTPTAPGVTAADLTAMPADSKGSNSSGGKGSPHFVTDFTSCEFDTSNGHMVCDYQVAGLGKNGHALITLDGLESLQYTCYSFQLQTGRFFTEIDIWGDASGNYKGTIDAAPIFGPICSPSHLSDVLWAPTDNWALAGAVDTKGGHTVPILYVQPLT